MKRENTLWSLKHRLDKLISKCRTRKCYKRKCSIKSDYTTASAPVELHHAGVLSERKWGKYGSLHLFDILKYAKIICNNNVIGSLLLHSSLFVTLILITGHGGTCF